MPLKFLTSETAEDYFINITAGLFLMGFIPGISRIRTFFKLKTFKKFWGKEIFKNPNVVIDVFNYDNSIQPNRARRYFKDFRNQPPVPIAGVDKVMGVETARAARFITGLFYRFSQKLVSIRTDEELISEWDGTYICFGSSDSNIKTKEILLLPENRFLDFDFDPKTGQRVIKRKTDGKNFKFSPRPPRDRSMVVKVTNPRFSDQKLFICAGLGEWGTAGAAWYLANKWKELLKEFGERDFGVVIETTPLSVESTTRIG